jgi:SAM-dependent methyltransferase
MIMDNPGHDKQRLYHDLSWLWPILSPPEDYEEEAELCARHLVEHASIPVQTVLHLGCGGGHLDSWMKRRFTITGVDLSDSMLDLARALNPEIRYLPGDMRTVRLPQKFDAVLIHDAINYMLTLNDLRAAFETAYHHLRPGGVTLCYAERYKGRFEQNRTTAMTRTAGEVELTYIENQYDPDPADTTYEYHLIYLIRTRGKLEIATDCHIAGIFELDEWSRLMADAGFMVERGEFTHSEIGPETSYPMFIGKRPA